jgi:hypothetical protein
MSKLPEKHHLDFLNPHEREPEESCEIQICEACYEHRAEFNYNQIQMKLCYYCLRDEYEESEQSHLTEAGFDGWIETNKIDKL